MDKCLPRPRLRRGCSVFFLLFLVWIGISDPQASPITLTIWHDQGPRGTAWFDSVGTLYRKTNPEVSIQSVSYSTPRWLEQSVAALKDGYTPDLLFNNYERLIQVQVATEGLFDLKEAIRGMKESKVLTEQDLKISIFRGKQIMVPLQRVQAAFGVRKSWLAAAGKPFPTTWSEMKSLASAFQKGDPDGNGKTSDTYGLALEGLSPRDLIHILDLFSFGSGVPHTIIDPEGRITINGPQHKALAQELVGLFQTFAQPGAVQQSFDRMYQFIEGGRAGMFRVGDWNVVKWDGKETLGGDYVIGPWPRFTATDSSSMVISGMRGAAVPKAATHRQEALKFLNFLLTKEAQQASLLSIGSAIRSDLDLSTLSEHARFFQNGKTPVVPYDFPETNFAYYPELEAIYHKALVKAISQPGIDWDSLMLQAEKEMKAVLSLYRR